MKKHTVLTPLLLAMLCGWSAIAAAQVPLGTAASYGVLGASTVTNTGPTVINADLGVSPGAAITGFPPGIRTGATHAADAAALQAQNDATTAYNFLAGQACGTILTGDLGGRTLTPGVYCFASSAQLTGMLTLDAQGVATSQFIFQIGSTLTTASASSVALVNGAQACNVWWQMGSSATLGTTTAFVGTLIALASNTLTTGATLNGRAIARTGAVTLDSNVITPSACAIAPGPVPGAPAPIPTLSEWAMTLLAALLAFVGFSALRKRS
jgi:hypothetical protein